MNQLSLQLHARAAGESAAEKCIAKAVRRVADFDREGAAGFIRGWLIRNGPMSGEQLTNAAKLHGYRPHDDRAFGSVYMGLVRKNLIRCIGYGLRAKGHGTGGSRIWEAV